MQVRGDENGESCNAGVMASIDRRRLPLLARGLIIWVLIIAALAGCASWERREVHRLDVWIGKSERKLVLAAGAPTAVHDLKDGGRILTWRQHHTERQGGETITETETRIIDGKAVNVPVTTQQPVFEFHYECTANFEIDGKGIVRAHSLKGNDCESFLK